MFVTSEMMKAKGACWEKQNEVFASEWPDGVEITLEVCKRAAGLGLSLDWFAENMLPAPALKAYSEASAPAWKAYNEATAPAWKAYKEATAPAWKTHKEATAPAWKTYNEAKAPAWKTYNEAKAPAWKAY
ncbi:hypothetical protein LCGC14_2944780, partial [marine sediment metagenome]